MRALLFAGAFNPVTKAHIELAKLALEKTGREVVIFLPSQSKYIENDQKKSYALSTTQRLSLLRLCAQKYPWMRISSYDLDQESQPRTYQSLNALKEQGYDCALLMGDDQFLTMEEKWLHVPEIAKEFGIVCLERTKNVQDEIQKSPFLKKIEPYVQVIPSPSWSKSVSSTKIRAWLSDQETYRKELEEGLPFSLKEMEETQ